MSYDHIHSNSLLFTRMLSVTGIKTKFKIKSQKDIHTVYLTES